jgi:hypothetical protein
MAVDAAEKTGQPVEIPVKKTYNEHLCPRGQVHQRPAADLFITVVIEST